MADEVVSVSSTPTPASTPAATTTTPAPAPATAPPGSTSDAYLSAPNVFKAAKEQWRKESSVKPPDGTPPVETKPPEVLTTDKPPVVSSAADDFIEFEGKKIPKAILKKAMEYGAAWPGGFEDYLAKLIENGGDTRAIHGKFHSTVEAKLQEAAGLRKKYEQGLADLDREREVLHRAQPAQPPPAPKTAGDQTNDDLIDNDPIVGPRFKLLKQEIADMKAQINRPDPTVTYLAGEQIEDIRKKYGDRVLSRTAQHLGLPLKDDMTPDLTKLAPEQALKASKFMRQWADDYVKSGELYENTINGVLDSVSEFKELPTIRALAFDSSFKSLYEKLCDKVFADQGGTPTKEQVEFIAKESARKVLIDIQKDEKRKAAVLNGAPPPIVPSGSSPTVKPQGVADMEPVMKQDGTFDAKATKLKLAQISGMVPKT